MKVLPAWALAAGILIREGRKLHYSDITDLILKSDLSQLGERGVSPERTICSQLGAKKVRGKKLFKRGVERSGYYDLVDPVAAARLPDVMRAIAALERLP